jgi:hydroxymethylpyrimidine/phosphomethylpyrimidine kinase
VTTHTALTVAGSDSCGGAGIEADLKTMAAFGVYGAAAVTSITAQNTLGVAASLHLPPELVAAQIDAVVEDIGADAAKTGMLATAGIVEAVADRVARHGIERLVVDPVMVATSGAPLMEGETVEVFRRVLAPLALVITPNVPEAEALSGIELTSKEAVEDAARAIAGLGVTFVLIKGGHFEDEATDTLYDGERFERLTAPRVPVGAVHGTGCTLSAAIASGLALGHDVRSSVSLAKRYVTKGIESALSLGHGSALVNHFVRLDDD